MRLAALRAFALGLPHATMTRQWGDNLVFKLAGKMFFMISLDGEMIESLACKCSPLDFQRLGEIEGIRPAPYLARASWVQIEDLAALSEEALGQCIRSSYDLVRARLPKKIQATLH